MSDDEDYDEMDALAAFLDDDEEENPYDRDDEPRIAPVRKKSLVAEVPVTGSAVMQEEDDEMNDLAAFLVDEEENPYNQDEESGSGIGSERPSVGDPPSAVDEPIGMAASDGVDQDKSTDEEKSKDELIDELRLMREQLKAATQSQQSQAKKKPSQELFSQALLESSVSKETSQKWKGPSQPLARKTTNPVKNITGAQETDVKSRPNDRLQPSNQSLEGGRNSTGKVQLEPSTTYDENDNKYSTREGIPKPDGPQKTADDKPPSKKSFRELFGSLASDEEEEGEKSEPTREGIPKPDEPQKTAGDKPASKKSFREMFGSLASDEEDEGEKPEPTKVSKFLADVKDQTPPEEKSASLAGGENSFYQSKRKRLAHASKSLTSPPDSNQSFLRDAQRSAPSPRTQQLSARKGASSTPQSTARKGASSTQEPWEIEPLTKIRISNPVVSMSALKVKMKQRTTLRLSVLKRHIMGSEIEMDWVTIGVVISKSTPKTSKNGKAFSVWKLNDLSTHCPLVALFLFGQSHDDHWKTAEGSVVGLLNAKVMPAKAGSDDISLSIDNPQKMIILGKSKDLGWCKGTRKDGGRCTSFVNKSECEWCDYHVQNQYKKQCARRHDLQATYSGLNPTDAMKKATQNVIYGGKHYNPKPLRPTKNPNKRIAVKKLGDKLKEEVKEELGCVTVLGNSAREDDTVVSISGSTKQFHSLLSKPCPGAQNFLRHMVDVDMSTNIVPVAAKDLLKQHQQNMASMIKSRKRTKEGAVVRGNDKENIASMSKTAPQFSEEKELKVKSRQEMMLEKLKKEVKLKAPTSDSAIGGEGPRIGASLLPGGDVDLDLGDTVNRLGPRKGPLRMTKEELAKARAVSLVRRKGQIGKKDPNGLQRSKKPLDEDAVAAIRKRTEENRKTSSDENTEEEQPKKRRRKMVMGEMIDLDSEEMKEILEGSSLFKGQLEAELEEKYFSGMEQKEKLELRMDSIMEKEVKVVSCKQCKFTWFCASQLCKKENHALKYHSANQRFFQCQGCQQRTISFYKYPTKHCRNCRGGKFVRVSMLNVKEKKDETLLLRGEERKWVM